MTQDLTKSNLHRQNVLNNRFALEQMENELSLGAIRFKGEPVFTKAQIANIFDVEERTIDNYIKNHNEELTKNGYYILRSRELNDFKNLADLDETNFVDINSKTPQLGIFSFKAFLNLSMLLTESNIARNIRSRILDITIQVIADKVENRAFVNQRDENYLPAAFWEEKYRAEFIDALKKYVKGNQWKYKHCADAMYKSIFKERATEYRKILNLEDGQNVRDTFYADLLTLIASFEAGIPEILEKEYAKKGVELTVKEAMDLIEDFGNQAFLKPLIQDIRTKIASRDYTLRDAIHNKLEAYIQAMPEADYETFLGEKSKALEEHIKDSIDVYKRLKDR